jgi:hypothetical protein
MVQNAPAGSPAMNEQLVGQSPRGSHLGNVDRPCPAPMILQQRIGKEAGTDRQRSDQEQRGLGFDQHAPPRKQKLANERDAGRHDQERDQRARRNAGVLRPHMGVERKIVGLRVVERRGRGKVEPRHDAEDDTDHDADRQRDDKPGPVHGR